MIHTVAKDKSNAITFGRRLRALREAKKMTQTELGAAAGGMKTSAISRLEKGESSPTWDTVLLLAEALGVTPDAFTEDEPEEKPAEKPASKKKSNGGGKPKK